MLYNYDVIYEKAVEEAQKTYTTSLSDREYLESFLEFSYILYNQEISSKTGEAKMSQDEINDVADVWMEDYEALYPRSGNPDKDIMLHNPPSTHLPHH